MDFRIRKYELKDRDSVRELCCDTGFLGNPIDPVFGDRDLFADIHTRYYLEKEPESAFIAEERGRVVGYVLGCKNGRDFERYFILRTLPLAAFKLIYRYFTQYNEKERKYARWLLFRSLREIPRMPKDSAHLHIDLERGHRSRETGKRLVEELFSYLRNNKVKKVWGGVFSFEKRKKPGLYEKVLERIGIKGANFTVYDKKETTAWRGLVKGKVYLLRVVREL